MNRGMSREPPLVMRLYQRPPLAELARLVGYDGIQLAELQAKVEPLGAAHGKGVVQAAFDEIAYIDNTASPPVARLKVHVRPLCFQLLGPPPEHPEHRRFYPDGKPEEPKPAEPTQKAKRRKKAS
jgi:hypothetical protein